MRVVFVGRDRPVWKRLVLYVVTFGISRRIWLHRINKEIDGHAALGINHTLNLVLLCLPIIGPFIVQCQTTKRLNNDLHNEANLTYGPTWALCLVGIVPILGNGFYLGWTQDRLNRYWAFERKNPKHGIDIDVGLEKDPQFIVELDDARRRSYHAGSRFDRDKRRRQERWHARIAGLATVGDERRAVRLAGGSVPALPWKRPERPERRALHITCGRCEHAFAAEQDPYAETILLCPKCGLQEILPSLRGDAFADPEPGGVVAVEADCPKCETHFHALRDLEGPTALVCPSCGKKDTLPAPKRVKA